MYVQRLEFHCSNIAYSERQLYHHHAIMLRCIWQLTRVPHNGFRWIQDGQSTSYDTYFITYPPY